MHLCVVSNSLYSFVELSCTGKFETLHTMIFAIFKSGI